MSEHHWRKEFTSNYFGSHLMPSNGSDVVLTISKVQPEDLTASDGSKKHGLVCYWADDQLPLVLNRTNAKQIAKLLKENDYTKWAGHSVQLYVDHKVKAFGDIVDGIRIRPKLPDNVKIKCEICKKDITPAFGMSVKELAKYTKDKYNKTICADCAKKEADKHESERG